MTSKSMDAPKSPRRDQRVAELMPPPTFGSRCLSLGFSLLLRAVSSTWRTQIEGLHRLEPYIRRHERYIAAFWHQHYITLFRFFHQRSTLIVTNQSQRGHIIAGICRRNGMQTLQIGHQRTGDLFRSLETATRGGLGLAVTVDGPLGPKGQAKRGIIRLAASLDCPIVPISVAAKRRIVCKNRWDQLEVPLIGSRVAYVVGSPIHVPQQYRPNDVRHLSEQLRNAINQGSETARSMVNHVGRR